MTPDGLLLCDDLLFASKVTATARAHGRTVTVCRDAGRLSALASEQRPRAILLDLNNYTLQLQEVSGWRAAGIQVVGFGSHVDVESLKAARAAGCDPVLPRSKFTAVLESELPRWLGSQQAADDQRPQPEDVPADAA